MSWCARRISWSALIELFVDSVDDNNGNVRRSFATSVNELMMTASENGESMTTAARYKSRVDACLATRMVSQWWQVLIIIKIRFVCFLKMILVGYVLDYVLDYMILGLMTSTLQYCLLQKRCSQRCITPHANQLAYMSHRLIVRLKAPWVP